MKDHFSTAGTTCWFCGHPAAETVLKLMDDVRYRCCRNCHHAQGTLEEIQALRDADVEGMKVVLQGGLWRAGYWTQGGLLAQAAEFKGYSLARLDALKTKPYEDAFALETFERLKARRKEYHAVQKDVQREKLKDFYATPEGKERAKARYALEREAKLKRYHEEGGKAAARDRYLNGGGKEYAKAYYEKKKAARLAADKPDFNNQGSGI